MNWPLALVKTFKTLTKNYEKKPNSQSIKNLKIFVEIGKKKGKKYLVQSLSTKKYAKKKLEYN